MDRLSVHVKSFIFEATFRYRKSSMDNPPIFFHVRPMEGDFRPRPWAYFSFTPEPAQDGTLMMNAAKRKGVCDRFVSNLPGVDAEVL